MKLSKMLATSAVAAALTASAASSAFAQDASPYVVGGSEANVEWMVQLEFQTHSGGTVETYGCSGEQLNDEWVLTARHCIDDVARMNVYQSNDQVDRGEPIAVDSVHAAPKGDIALVHLSKEAPLSSYAEVDTTYEVPENTTHGHIYGFGLGAYKQPTDHLRTATVNIDGTSTDAFYGKAAHLTGNDGASNHGDSGGPLVVNGKVVAVCSTGDNADPRGDIHAGSNYALLSQTGTWIETTAGVDVTPEEETPAPVDETPAPVDETPAPVEEPIDETPAPVEEPVEEPVDELPADDTDWATGDINWSPEDILGPNWDWHSSWGWSDSWSYDYAG